VPRHCSICHHERLEEIDQALVEGAALSEIAAKHRVSDDALSRHRTNHLPDVLLKAQRAKETVRADDLLSQVRELQSRTLAILEEAHDSGEHRTALSAIGQARANLELQARLLQLIKEGPTINISTSAEWVELRALIISALEPYEAARSAVVGALEGADDGTSS